MKEYQAVVDGLYRYVTVALGVKDVTVAYGGWYAFVFCANPQDEHFVGQKLPDGWHGVVVVGGTAHDIVGA